MIDTDKYEGCKTTAWRCLGQPYTELAEAVVAIRRNGPDPCTPADLELWADAPLLLAEVKRLREEISNIARNMDATDPVNLQDFIKDLYEVIE